jgi:hypothetical protein
MVETIREGVDVVWIRKYTRFALGGCPRIGKHPIVR